MSIYKINSAGPTDTLVTVTDPEVAKSLLASGAISPVVDQNASSGRVLASLGLLFVRKQISNTLNLTLDSAPMLSVDPVGDQSVVLPAEYVLPWTITIFHSGTANVVNVYRADGVTLVTSLVAGASVQVAWDGSSLLVG